MNLIIVEDKDYIDENTVRLKERRYNHIRSVHKAKEGDSLRVGQLNGKVGQGIISEINQEYVDLDVEMTGFPPGASKVQIIMAMPRPKVFRRLLMDLTTMGIKDIYIINTWRVEKSFFKSPVLEEDKLKETMILGLEQAKDTVLPNLEIRNLFRPFVEDEIPDIISNTKAIVAHPTGKIWDTKDINEKTTVLIGPEGGLIPFEIELLESQGFEVVTLGDRILRVETVLPYIVGKLS